jgi:hypothetical protein
VSSILTTVQLTRGLYRCHFSVEEHAFSEVGL